MSYSVVQLDPAEAREAVFGIWTRCYGTGPGTRYDWLYLENPAGRARVWVARHEASGAYVGAAALFPRDFVADGERCLAGIAGDLVVDPGHRTGGPALMLQRAVASAVEAGVVDFAYAFPNRASEPIFKRIGWTALGARSRFLRLLRTRRHLAKLPLGRYWSAPVAAACDTGLRLLSADIWPIARRSPDAEPDGDFEGAAPAFVLNRDAAFRVFGVRSPQYLRWKFRRRPAGPNAVLTVRNGTGGRRGYLVYRRHEDTIEIRDFAPQTDAETLSALVSALASRARQGDAEALLVAAVSNPATAALLGRLGFIRRPDDLRIYALVPRKSAVRWPSLARPERWFLLQGDDDL